MDAHFHLHLPAKIEQAGDKLGKIGAKIFEIDEYVHEEEAANDALLDVLDVDPTLGHVSGELRDDAFLVFPQNTHNCHHRLRHE
jgi:hypothetical protein